MNKVLRVLAIDDEPLALEQLSIYISKTPSLQLVKACQSANEAIEEIDKGGIDAIFLDICMPDMSGMELAKALKNTPLIVFTTAYSEFAIEGYKVNAVDYLLKPFGFNEFTEAVERLISRSEMVKKDNDDTLFVKSEYKIVKLSIPSILYAESMGEYMKIFTKVNDKESITFVIMTVGKLLDQLAKYNFKRVHRSYLVNFSHIEKISKGNILLDNGKMIPIGDFYKNEVKDWISK